MKRWFTFLLIVLIVAAVRYGSAHAQTPASPRAPDWSRFQFLVGGWVADPDPAAPGATGSTDFHFDLENHVLMRDNRADYPARDTMPASRHRDMMVIFADPTGMHAIYWDNEPHKIDYDVVANADGSVTFATANATGVRYRMVYSRASDGVVAGRFDIAPSGGAFKTYKQWTMHRR
jgi:hypothetical protein